MYSVFQHFREAIIRLRPLKLLYVLSLCAKIKHIILELLVFSFVFFLNVYHILSETLGQTQVIVNISIGRVSFIYCNFLFNQTILGGFSFIFNKSLNLRFTTRIFERNKNYYHYFEHEQYYYHYLEHEQIVKWRQPNTALVTIGSQVASYYIFREQQIHK